MSMMGVVRPTGHLDMTISVDWVVKFKQTRQDTNTQSKLNTLKIYILYFLGIYI